MDTIDYDYIAAALLTVADVMERGYQESGAESIEVGQSMEAVGPDMLVPAFEKYGIDGDGLIEHVMEMIDTMRSRGVVTHPMGAAIVSTKFIQGVFLGMQMAKDRDERSNPEAAFFGEGS